MRRTIAALVLAMLVMALLAGSGKAPLAEAHALLVRADPPPNSQLAQAPRTLTLYFSEPLERKVSTVRMLDAHRARVDTTVEFDDADDALMRVSLPRLEPGYYTVIWETLSKVDGHRITGQYPLTILNADGSLPAGQPAPAAAATSVSGAEVKPERAATRWVLLVAGALLTGSLGFAWVTAGAQSAAAAAMRRAAASRILLLAAGCLTVLAAAGAVEVALQARAVLGSVSDVPEVIRDTRWGERWLIRNALLVPVAFGLLALRPRREDGRLPGPVTAILLALALAYLAVTAAVSHAAAGRGAVWATASDFVHLVAASVWVGMLLQLLLTVRWAGASLPRPQQPVVVAEVLQRFSLIAVLSVAALLATGVFNAAVELHEPSDLLDTAYGRTLLVKLVLTVPLLLAGAFNAYLFRPQVVEEADRAETNRRGGVSAGWEELAATLARTVRLEFLLALAVLASVGVLTQTSPSRSALAAPVTAGKYVESRSADALTATLQVDPNEPGQNAFTVYLTGAVDTVERVRLVFLADRKGAFQSDLVLDRSPISSLIYNGAGAFIDEPGSWIVTVNLRRSAGTDLDLRFRVPVVSAGVAPAASRGGPLDVPRDFSLQAWAAIAVALALSVALVLASLDRPGRPAGRMGDWADALASMEMHPSVSLAALILVGIGLGIVLGTHGHQILGREQAREGNPVEANAKSIERGRMLFAANCAQCHGDTGRGDGPLASSLRLPPANLYEHIPYHPDQFFFNIITNGYQGVMPAFGSALSEEDRWHILNFLRDQFGAGAEAQ